MLRNLICILIYFFIFLAKSGSFYNNGDGIVKSISFALNTIKYHVNQTDHSQEVVENLLSLNIKTN